MGNGKIRKRNKRRNNMEKSIINCKRRKWSNSQIYSKRNWVIEWIKLGDIISCSIEEPPPKKDKNDAVTKKNTGHFIWKMRQVMSQCQSRHLSARVAYKTQLFRRELQTKWFKKTGQETSETFFSIFCSLLEDINQSRSLLIL